MRNGREVRIDFETLLGTLASNNELAHTEVLPARAAQFAPPPSSLPAALRERLPAMLWTHQAEAIEHAMAGRSVVVATGTASGKSLCYQAPIAAAGVAEGVSTALLLFPTKALAQDQLRALTAWETPGVVAVTYDGDTGSDERVWARRHANVILTNPDMLHQGILPNHGRWAAFLRRLRYVVVDELHTYRGIFGTHVAHVLRRLRRVCEFHGGKPSFVFASATIGKPVELASQLCGLPVELVDLDGSPQGERLLAVWNPPRDAKGVPVSGNAATAKVLAGCIDAGYRSIAFTRSRRATELVAARAQRLVAPTLSATVRSYRGGYLPAERREIEQQFMSGALMGIAATNALELGVDIGALDACVLNGFPGTIASFRQQIGRAGRSAQRSLAVLVAGDDALDQWYAANPRQLVVRQPEPSVVNPGNPFVAVPQTACAAHEIPLAQGESDALWGRHGEAIDDAVRQLVTNDQLTIVNGRAVWSGRGSPAPRVSLRAGGGAEFRIVDTTARLIGTVDGGRALSTLHAGALYLHQGQQYRVTNLDLDDRAAWVEAVDVDEYTQARYDTSIRLLQADHAVLVGRLALRIGAVEVNEQVVGYQSRRITTNEILGETELNLPPSTLVTRAFWYEVPDSVLEDAGLGGAGAAMVPGAVHATEHAGIGMLPLFTICDRWDVGGVSTARHEQNGLATIVIYDGYPGGAGIAELGFAAGEQHLSATLEAITRCVCASGCPSCVQSPKCGNGNEPLEKDAAVALLRAAGLD